MKYYCFIDFETTGLDCRNDFPIEVAAVLTSINFEELEVYSSLIRWPNLTDNGLWLHQYQQAADVHKISPNEYEKHSRPPEEVVANITALCPPESKTILTSDNIHFDYGFMEALYERVGAKLPYSYLGFDTGLLFDVCGVKDPDAAHRALADVRLVLDAVRQSTSVIRG
ncbi:MAG: 3'-5' exonuclease [Planctomycetota bacterium]|jgi:oligoribonuclease